MLTKFEYGKTKNYFFISLVINHFKHQSFLFCDKDLITCLFVFFCFLKCNDLQGISNEAGGIMNLPECSVFETCYGPCSYMGLCDKDCKVKCAVKCRCYFPA